MAGRGYAVRNCIRISSENYSNPVNCGGGSDTTLLDDKRVQESQLLYPLTAIISHC